MTSSPTVHPCALCGNDDRKTIEIARPHFDLPRKDPREQAEVYRWLSRNPTKATFCDRHVADLVAAGVAAASQPRLLAEVLIDLWFCVERFGHPLWWSGALWKNAARKSVIVAVVDVPPTADDRLENRRQKSKRKVEERRRHKKSYGRIRRALDRIPKFNIRGFRRRGQRPAIDAA